ncbi:hypothetical protein TPAR_08077, partial [Tolypocladium paradoxum]
RPACAHTHTRQRTRPRKDVGAHPPHPPAAGRGGPRPGAPLLGRPDAREGAARRQHKGVQQRPVREADVCRRACADEIERWSVVGVAGELCIHVLDGWHAA